jgi:hypothetical protein
MSLPDPEEHEARVRRETSDREETRFVPIWRRGDEDHVEAVGEERGGDFGGGGAGE